MNQISDGHMRDVMTDLETRGDRPGSIILSIGAVAFADDLSPRHFYTVVNTASCRAAGLIDTAETMAWWADQSAEARAVLDEAEASPVTLRAALGEFASFLGRYGGPPHVRLWGNGSDFDNTLLAAAFTAVDMPTPWRFWNNRCFRTLKNLTTVPSPPREGIHHNALDDAIFQATHAVSILSALPRAA